MGHAKEAVTLVAAWSGGSGIDVVKISHNAQLVHPSQMRVYVSGQSACIQYDAIRTRRGQVEALFAFLGDTRTQLRFTCFVDGAPVGRVVREDTARHRWRPQTRWTRDVD